MHTTMPVPSVRQRNPNLTESIDGVVRKALSKNPEDRFQTGSEMRAAFEAALREAEAPPELTVHMATAQVTAAPPPTTSESFDLDTMYNQLLMLTRERNWRAAVNLAAQILARDPNFRDVSAILSSASNELRFGRTAGSIELQLQDLLGQAEVAIADGRLLEAASMLQQILRTSPNDNYARARLEVVNSLLAEQETLRRRVSRLDQLYTLAQSKIRSGDWPWASNILEEISSLDPGFRDVEDLLVVAKEALREAQAQDNPELNVHELRESAEQAMAEERWSDAVRFWEAVLRLEPKLAGIAERLEVAQTQATLAALSEEAAKLAADGRYEDAIQKLEEIKALTER